MAFSAIAGIAAYGSAAIAAGTLAIGWTAALGAFALGAGLSMVSRALMPKPSVGQQLTGLEFTVREPDATRKIIYGRTRVGGAVVFIDTTDGDEDNEYIHMVLAFAGHEIDGFEEIYANQEKIWDDVSLRKVSWQPYLEVNVHNGDQTTADAELVARSNKWTSDHILNDTAYVYIRLKYDAEFFSSGLPNFSAVIRGKKVLNPITSVTEWTQNPALCAYDYLLDTKYGLAEPAANINLAELTAAVSLCDEPVALAAGGDQPRYTLDGVLDTGNSKKDNIEAMLSAMSGRLVYSGGEYFISGGAYVAPTVTIDESIMVGSLEVQTKQSRRGLYNGVKGVFRSEEDNYNTADYPAQLSSSFSTEDGDPIYLDMALPFTTNNIRAQRIAKLALLQSRQQTTVTIPCNLTALKFKAGDNVMVSNTKMGWDQKVFQVIGYELSLTGSGEIAVNVQAIETAAAIYDWTSSDEEDYLAGGELSLYDGRTVAAPTQFTGAASTATNLDGTIVPQIVSTWTASTDAFVVKYDYQWSIDNTNWNSADVEGTQFTISPAIGAATYYTRVRAINELGVRSVFETANVTAIGDNIAPALPTSLSATAGYKSISLEWTNPADKDFSNVEVYRATSSGGTFSLVASIGGGWGAATEFSNGGLADATAFFYKFKSVDYSGNKSEFTDEVSATTNAASISGTDGKSTYNAPIFLRKSTAPLGTPTGGTFNFGTNTLTPPTSPEQWYATVPTGTDDLYQCNFQFSIVGDTGTVTAGTWSPPRKISGEGEDGTSSFTFNVYRRSDDEPTAPSGGSYNFTTNTITNPSDWYADIPAVNGDPLWSSSTTAKITGATGTDSNLSWGPISKVMQDGESITGDTGPRSAAGYVYYSLSQTNSPNSPTATDYDFDTGSFGGLVATGGDTGVWSRTPPTNTGGDAKYWASSYIISETEYDENPPSTITFNTPFASFQFDGLVTFTNLNSELADASSTEITTINGGLLKTGTIEADRIRIDGVGIDVLTNGTEKTLQIGDSGVTTVKIDALAVTEGKIADLAVDTLKIADQAVTIPSGSITTAPAYTEWGSGSTETINGSTYYVPVLSSVAQWRTISSITFTSAGGNVFLTFSGELAAGVYTNDQEDTLGRTNIQFQILRDTTVIQTGFIKGNYVPVYGNLALSLNLNRMIDNYGNAVSISALDSTTSGSHTWSLRARPILQEANYDDFVAANRNFSVSALEVKK